MCCVRLLQMVVRSPFLMGLSPETLQGRMEALQTELADCNVHRMAEYCPSLLEVMLDSLVLLDKAGICRLHNLTGCLFSSVVE